MSRAYNPKSKYDPLSISRHSVETFKSSKRDTTALLARAFSLLDSSAPFDYAKYTFDEAIPQIPLKKQSPACSLIDLNETNIASEIDEIVDRSRYVSPKPSVKRERSFVAEPSPSPCVHPRPADDSHYPYNVQRKSRTKMRSGVCVWCAAQTLMSMRERPVLRKRISGSDADWERWMRELASPRSTFLRYLAEVLMPKHELLQIIKPTELAAFYKEMAGALIEIALRELRSSAVDERAIMAQVRSSKYHKTARVAQIIECMYE